MGYFNIFYKITRIIDMLTRKRNRKFILALCLIGAIVFFSPNTSNAQWSNFDSTNLTNIRTLITSIESKIDTYIPDMYGSIYSTDLNTQIIKSYVSNISSQVVYMRSDLQTAKNTLLTMNDSIDHIDNDIHDMLTRIDTLLSKIDTIQDTLDNIESILNSIGEDINTYGQLNHQDQEELKDLLREYLYGDNDTFNVVGQNYPGLFFNNSNSVVRTSAVGYIWEFQIHKGYNYTFNFSSIGGSNNSVSYVFKDNKIGVSAGVDMSASGQTPIQTYAIPNQSDGDLVVLGDRDCYIYFSTWNNLILNSAITDYNPRAR